MSQSVNWSTVSATSGTPLPAVTDSGRSRMSIPNLVHSVTTTAEANMYGERRALGDSHGGGGGREETGLQSPTESRFLVDSSSSSSKRKPPPGPRFYCTYAHPFSGKQCVSWVQGFSSQSDLSRHYMNIHGQEEIRLIKNGQLTYQQAQVVTSPEKLQRLESHFSATKYCESCGTAFLSGRRDAISRHVRNGVCNKKLKDSMS